MNIEFIKNKLFNAHSLTLSEYEFLLDNRSDILGDTLKKHALDIRNKYYKNHIYLRGLIEISNYCANNCYYCGIRKNNFNIKRYRLNLQQILDCCKRAWDCGIKTFVLQGGDDAYFSDDKLVEIIKSIKALYKNCAVTLSLGERSYESYKSLYDAGADRYLLRHETADDLHYKKLHPKNMSFDNRIQCLYNLREIGYQTGCGFMVGSPYQTNSMLAKDLKFIEEFQPEMCGIGPFIPHRKTKFANENPGSVKLTCFLLSIIRIICPAVLLPATTALATLEKDGYIKGIKSGANVIMPNITPMKFVQHYNLYDGKEKAIYDNIDDLSKLQCELNNVGFEIVNDIGNPSNLKNY